MRIRNTELMITLLCSGGATGTGTMTIGEAAGASPATSPPGTETEVIIAFFSTPRIADPLCVVGGSLIQLWDEVVDPDRTFDPLFCSEIFHIVPVRYRYQYRTGTYCSLNGLRKLLCWSAQVNYKKTSIFLKLGVNPFGKKFNIKSLPWLRLVGYRVGKQGL